MDEQERLLSATHETSSFNERKLSHRSHSAPPLLSYIQEAIPETSSFDLKSVSRPSHVIVRHAFIGIVLYVFVGIIAFYIGGSFEGTTTNYKSIDALYFTVVTLCTIGYGDIVPNTTFTKLFTSCFILVGFGLVFLLLNGLVNYICDRQEEALLLNTMDESSFKSMVRTYMIDTKKGRMRIRIKVFLALAVVIVSIGGGTFALHSFEEMSWVDSFYLSVTSVTTVGYGDYAFNTAKGRIFAIIWLLGSTFAVAKSVIYLTDLRIDKRNRQIADLVLQKRMTMGDFVAADLDKDGSISQSDFIIYKLKQMGKIADKDILQICNQFNLMDSTNSGKITLSDLRRSDYP